LLLNWLVNEEISVQFVSFLDDAGLHYLIVYYYLFNPRKCYMDI